MYFHRRIKQLAVFLTLCITLCVFTGGAFAADPDLEVVRTLLQDYYVTPLSSEQLQGNSVDEIIRKLDDPYTTLFVANDYDDFTDTINGNYKGIGVVVGEREGYIEVTSVLENSPAKAAGLQPKDLIVAVGDTDVYKMPQAEVVKLIRGEPGTKVSLKIKRGNQILHFVVTRQEVQLPIVQSKLLANNILYLQLASFASNSASLVEKEINKYPQVEGIILDLRNNGGGYVNAAVGLGKQFLGSGPLLWLQNRQGMQPLNLNGEAKFKQPMVLLVNQGSASASEIIAGAFQDYGRAVLVGQTTFGKFCMQQVVDLGDGNVLKFTVSYFLTPAQRFLHKIGVRPDVFADEQKALAVASRLVYDQRLIDKNYRHLMTINSSDLTAYINAKKAFSGKLLFNKDRFYLNLRDAAGEIGFMVWWDEQAGKVMVQRNLEPTEVVIDGQQALIKDGSTYVSVRKLAELLGGSVDYVSAVNEAVLRWN